MAIDLPTLLRYIYKVNYILHSMNGSCMHWPACEKISPMNAGKYLGVKKHTSIGKCQVGQYNIYSAMKHEVCACMRVCACVCVHVMSSIKIVTTRTALEEAVCFSSRLH